MYIIASERVVVTFDISELIRRDRKKAHVPSRGSQLSVMSHISPDTVPIWTIVMPANSEDWLFAMMPQDTLPPLACYMIAVVSMVTLTLPNIHS